MRVLKTAGMVLLDVLSVIIAAGASLHIIYDGAQMMDMLADRRAVFSLLITVILTITICWVLRLYRSIWKYAGIEEALLTALASFASSVMYAAVTILAGLDYSSGVYIIYFTVLTVCIALSRFLYRTIRFVLRRGKENYGGRTGDRIMLVGAGEAGNMLLRQIQADYARTYRHVVCIVDDDETKIGMQLHGVPVIGGRDKIRDAVSSFNVGEIILAIPSLKFGDRSEILRICNETGCKLRILPNIYSMMHYNVEQEDLLGVEIEDLLGRDPIKLDMSEISGYIRGKRVMVTGGGGSIGSELCRQIAKRGPAKLVIFDIYENTTYEVENELRRDFPGLDLDVVIGSVRDRARIESVINLYKPQVLFHAAAHKHVPLMETSPHEAVKNNIFGTLNTVRAADAAGVGRFVLISTDKAVRPTNVMGATKRICEMICQSYSITSKTRFTAVRFGNVLGSHGSVIPLFREQIAHGGPVMVTDPEITRYFMTIPEAVSLVLQAGAYASGGEVFVLDMGEPVKILDLAKNLIRLSGYEPDRDMKIEFIGLRPGEKLYEELLIDREKMQRTANELIFIEKPAAADEKTLYAGLDRLKMALEDESADIRPVIKSIVTDFCYSDNEVEPLLKDISR